jgi:hypothetical protein
MNVTTNIQIASQKKYIFITGTNMIMLFEETIAVNLSNLTKNVSVQRGTMLPS